MEQSRGIIASEISGSKVQQVQVETEKKNKANKMILEKNTNERDKGEQSSQLQLRRDSYPLSTMQPDLSDC